MEMLPSINSLINASDTSEDCDLRVSVKHTFIHVEHTSVDAQPKVPRARTYPLHEGDSAAEEGGNQIVSNEPETLKPASDRPDSDLPTILLRKTISPASDLPETPKPENLYPETPMDNALSDSTFAMSMTCSACDLLSNNLVSIPIWQALYTHVASQERFYELGANCSDLPSNAERESEVCVPLQEQHRLTCCCSQGAFRVMWHVEKRRLSSQEKQIISPSFFISLGEGLPEASCKLVLNAQGQSFKRSRGHGQIHIKCETVLPEAASWVSARFMVGAGLKEQPARGPVVHSFDESATCGLSKKHGVWDLRASVNKMTKTLAIRVEIIPMASGGDVTLPNH